MDAPGPSVNVFWIERQRRPDLHSSARRKLESGRHDTNNGEWLRVQLDCAPDDLASGAEDTLPESVTDHGNTIGPDDGFIGSETSAHGRVRLQHGEQFGRGSHR